MSEPLPVSEKLWPLLNAACDGALAETQIQELEAILVSDPVARKTFADHLQLRTDIRFLGRVEKARDNGLAGVRAACAQATECPSSPAFPGPVPALHGLVGYFASGWPAAYLAATVIVGAGFLIGALAHVPQPGEVGTQSSTIETNASASRQPTRSVGRVTGMVDCRWADPATASLRGEHVPLGRKYAIASGLMQITYETGAAVILQGPATYEVHSANGGFLSIGKLVGKVTAEAARGFTIHTPTAAVTDLGTEFGVEVDKRGATTSQVFRGTVRLEATSSDGPAHGSSRILLENESARVTNESDTPGGDDRIVLLDRSAPSIEFVRAIPTQTVTTLDLVDVVAGGNGFSGKRDAGIDATSGQVVRTYTMPTVIVDGKYHRVPALPFVDGVFIPDARAGGVQIDSAGHVFTGFPATAYQSAGDIWAGEDIPFHSAGKLTGVIPTDMGDADDSSARHSVVFLHANKGITFDLEAIRRANPDRRVVRFRATARNTVPIRGNQEAGPRADMWVFVDGSVRFQRQRINGWNVASWIAIPLHNNDRFLTLAATDGGDGIDNDWTMFVDPLLELTGGNTRPSLPITTP